MLFDNLMKRVFMLGHSNHPLDHFFALLDRHRVTVLIDVRSSPNSRFPWFVGQKLARYVSAVGIRYEHWPQLGGKPPAPKEQLRASLEGLERAYGLAFERATNLALMCSEGKHLECHRHYLLAPVLLEMGYDVLQIQTDGSIVSDAGPTGKTLRKMAAFLPAGAYQEPQASLF